MFSTILKSNFLLFILILLVFSGCKDDDEISGKATKVGDSPIVIHVNNRVISYNLGDGYQGYVKTPNSRNIIKEVYKHFEDDFDFITILLNEPKKPEGAFGTYNNIENITENIGINKFDNSEQYGSEKLQGIVSLSALHFLRRGPSLHEIAHKWGNYIFPEATHPLLHKGKANGAHWATTGGNTSGQLGGFPQKNLKKAGGGAKDWHGSYSFPEDQINDNFNELNMSAPDKNWGVEMGFAPHTAGGNRGPYNQLELYTMGLIEAEEIEPFDLFTRVNAIYQSDPPPRTGPYKDIFFNAPDPIRYTSDLVMKKTGGRRLPLPKDQQKDYKMLVVVVTGTPLTDEQWNIIDEDAKWFGQKEDDGDPRLFNFWEATGGRATMDTENIDKSLK